MKSPRLRALLFLLVLALVAAACSGSESASSVDTAASDRTDIDPTPAPADSDTADTGASGTDEPDGTDETDGADSSTTDTDSSTTDTDSNATDTDSSDTTTTDSNDTGLASELDPTTTLVRALFNIDPSPEAIECLNDERENRPLLDEAIIENQPFFTGYSDDKVSDVTRGINGCVDPLALGGWAAAAVSPSEGYEATARTCFAEAFGDGDLGDDLFHAFIALSFQFRYDPAISGDLVNMLSECTPAASLSDFFASTYEQDVGFTVEVDRECLHDALTPREVSDEFWTTFVDGAVPPPTAVEPHIVPCEVDAFAGMADAIPDDFEPWGGTGALADVAPAARLNAYSSPPPMSIDPAGSYTAVFATGEGEIRIRLFADSAPITVNNFVSLARDGYFDGTVFHRVLDGFMAQGGDPTGTGTGGPGYQFADEVDGGPSFDRPGLLAMANSGPGTNGSQFFITFVPTDWLDGNHTIFGEVVEGMDLVNAIERRDPSLPNGRGQVLESVTIVEE